MMERTTTRTVSFQRPFKLAAVDGPMPAGAYTIETEEEQIAGLSFVAYRRVRTSIILPAGGFGSAMARQVVTIEPEDLEATLRRDADTPGMAE